MHLLKQASKPVPATRKKRKYEIMGDLSEFKVMVSESAQKPKEGDE